MEQFLIVIDTIHQPPDFVSSTLLPSIPQVKMDLAVAINAARLQPELFYLPRQFQVLMMPPRIWSLKPGVKATGMHIQHPTKQTNRPAPGVITDKGVPQPDGNPPEKQVLP